MASNMQDKWLYRWTSSRKAWPYRDFEGFRSGAGTPIETLEPDQVIDEVWRYYFGATDVPLHLIGFSGSPSGSLNAAREAAARGEHDVRLFRVRIGDLEAAGINYVHAQTLVPQYKHDWEYFVIGNVPDHFVWELISWSFDKALNLAVLQPQPGNAKIKRPRPDPGTDGSWRRREKYYGETYEPWNDCLVTHYVHLYNAFTGVLIQFEYADGRVDWDVKE